MSTRLSTLLLLTFLALTPACGKRTLNPSGPYQGNMGLFVQDEMITTLDNGLRSFLVFEMQNRLIVPAAVSQFADKVRTNRFKWNSTALRLRDAYALAPTPENESAFRAALNEIQQAVTEASVYMAAQKGR